MNFYFIFFLIKMSEKYSTEVYEAIRDALDLPKGSEKKYWVIEDHVPNTSIYLIHYVSENIHDLITTEKHNSVYDIYDSQAILILRGLIIDIEDPKNPWICCRTNGFTGETNMDKISKDENTSFDQVGNKFNFNSDDVFFQPFYSGPVLRLWKYKGKTYCSSNHKISTKKSRWGSSDFFESLFIKTFSPNCKTLEDVGNLVFQNDKPTSNLCYNFILNLPGISLGSRTDIGLGFLVYINSITLNVFYNPESFQHFKDHESIEMESLFLKNNTFIANQSFNKNNVPVFPSTSEESDKLIMNIPSFDYKTANKILSYGYTDLNKKTSDISDIRLLPGESIIMCFKNVRQFVKIIPTCTMWRNAVLNNTPNIYNQFFHLMNKIGKIDYKGSNKKYIKFEPTFEDKEYTYEELFLDFGNPTNEELLEVGKNMVEQKNFSQVYFKNNKAENLKNEKIKNICLSMLYVVPFNYIIETSNFYDDYLNDLEDTIEYINKNLKYLGGLVENNKVAEDIRFGKPDGKTLKASGKSLEFLIKQSLIGMNTRIQNNKIYKYDPKTKQNKKMTEKEILQENISNFLKGMNGQSLYSLIVACSKELKEEK